MEIIKQYIIKENGAFQILMECKDGSYFKTCTGAFGQRPMAIDQISKDEFERLLPKLPKVKTPKNPSPTPPAK